MVFNMEMGNFPYCVPVAAGIVDVFIGNPLIIPSDTLGGYAPAAAAPPIRITPYYLHKKKRIVFFR